MFKLVVVSVALAVASASPSGILGGLASPLNVGIVAPLGGHLAAPIIAAPLAAVGPIGAYNYRSPLSLAPGQPANILAADGRPLDTLSVNLDRAAHLTAKAIEGSGHLLKKRSIVGAPLLAAPLAATPLAAGAVALSPLATTNLVTAHLAGAGLIAGPLAAPVAIAPLGLGHGIGLGHIL